MKLSVPRWSSAPHRPQLETFSMYASMVAAGLAVGYLFEALGLVPDTRDAKVSLKYMYWPVGSMRHSLVHTMPLPAMPKIFLVANNAVQWIYVPY